jgi:hypothetical protein
MVPAGAFCATPKPLFHHTAPIPHCALKSALAQQRLVQGTHSQAGRRELAAGKSHTARRHQQTLNSRTLPRAGSGAAILVGLLAFRVFDGERTLMLETNTLLLGLAINYRV